VPAVSSQATSPPVFWHSDSRAECSGSFEVQTDNDRERDVGVSRQISVRALSWCSSIG